jgi:putative DNA primase/helicase
LWVGEGIETALSPSEVTKYRHPAIAVPGGNFKHIAPPSAKTIIILSDNDANGSGLRKAQEAATLWARNGRSVRIALAPNPYKDWNDAVRDPNADRNQLRHLLINAESVTPQEYEPRALTMGELLDRDFPPREQLLPPWLATGSLAMLHAERGAGKTRFVMSVGFAIASGQSFLKWCPSRPARTLYVDGELPATLLQQRVKLLGPATPNFCLLSRDILLREAQVTIPSLESEEGREFLDAIIEREKAELIVLDSISTLTSSGAENDPDRWAPIQDWALQHRFHGRAIMFIHHEGRKTKSQRGTTKREDVLDTILRLEQLKDEDATGDEVVKFELTFTKCREFHGVDAESLIVHLSTKSGVAEWTYETKRCHVRERAEELQGEGFTQTEIAEQLNLTQGRVSQILNQRD